MTNAVEQRLSHADDISAPVKYQPHLDGLRAVAVLSVLACHLDLRGMHGGFVGVDVFFVISGYLISTIILTETAAGRFSLAAFYERRIRRIFPALFAMLLAMTAIAWLFLLPAELVAYSRSLIAAALSGSNLYFNFHAGYFDQPRSYPLLHTWSLGVEEQFYIFFPLFVLAVRRWFPTRIRLSIVLCAMASLILSAYAVYHSRNAAFYLPQCRAWELLIGTLLSLHALPPLRSTVLRNAASAAGFAAVGFSVLLYNAATPFPGLAALVPCLGAALMIESSRSGDSLIRRLLSWAPMRFIGRISYSLYLWHWPIIVLGSMGIFSIAERTIFSSWLSQTASVRVDAGIEVVASFAVAVVSWKVIETPFRDGSIRLSRAFLFRAAATAMAGACAISAFAIHSGGFKERFSPQVAALASYLGDTRDMGPTRMGVCFITTADHFENFKFDTCLRRSSDKPNYLLLGDSHSAVIWPALAKALDGSNIMQANTSGCPPVLHPLASGDCRRMMQYVYQTYLRDNHVDGLLLESRWHQEDIPSLDESIAWAHAHNVHVVLFGPVPEYDIALPRLEAYSVMWSHPELISFHRVRAIGQLDEQLASLAAERWHVPYVSLYRTICPNESCMMYMDAAHTKPVMFDSNHLTAEAAQLVVDRIVRQGALD
jgi:peptidoglycan/LPS O-acetylase OafA/YrhL